MKIQLNFPEDIILRILFIGKIKNTKTMDFKALNRKNDFKNCEIKNLVSGRSTNGGETPTLKLFQINSQQ